MSVTVR